MEIQPPCSTMILILVTDFIDMCVQVPIHYCTRRQMCVCVRMSGGGHFL